MPEASYRGSDAVQIVLGDEQWLREQEKALRPDSPREVEE